MFNSELPPYTENDTILLRRDLQLNGYPQGFIDSVINSYGIPYVKGAAEMLRRVGNRYNIRMIFETKHTLRSSLKRTWPKRDQQQTAQRVHSIPCECGRNYIGETGRLLAVRLREHRHNLQQGFLEKSKLVQHGY
jgi:hypothetical protein